MKHYDVIRVLRCYLLFDGCPREECGDKEFCCFVVNRFEGLFTQRVIIEWEYDRRIKRLSFEELLERIRRGEFNKQK